MSSPEKNFLRAEFRHPYFNGRSSLYSLWQLSSQWTLNHTWKCTQRLTIAIKNEYLEERFRDLHDFLPMGKNNKDLHAQSGISILLPYYTMTRGNDRTGGIGEYTQMSCTASWELWKHPDPPPGGRPLFFKPEWPKESKNGFKTISYRPYPLVFFSNYFFRYQKSSKKSHGITSDSFPNNFYAL